MIMGMALVQLDKRHRVTLPKKLRKRFKIVEGQKFYLIPSGDDLIMRTVPKDPSKELAKILGDFQFGKKDRRTAEKWLLETTGTRRRKNRS
jgi:bifunctional DNA-binding transcriptional regulator/antitoxin component of YhaV-PrlF toxin-antitoxin module